MFRYGLDASFCVYLRHDCFQASSDSLGDHAREETQCLSVPSLALQDLRVSFFDLYSNWELFSRVHWCLWSSWYPVRRRFFNYSVCQILYFTEFERRNFLVLYLQHSHLHCSSQIALYHIYSYASLLANVLKSIWNGAGIFQHVCERSDSYINCEGFLRGLHLQFDYLFDTEMLNYRM